jgi:hypothetical protein
LRAGLGKQKFHDFQEFHGHRVCCGVLQLNATSGEAAVLVCGMHPLFTDFFGYVFMPGFCVIGIHGVILLSLGMKFLPFGAAKSATATLSRIPIAPAGLICIFMLGGYLFLFPDISGQPLVEYEFSFHGVMGLRLGGNAAMSREEFPALGKIQGMDGLQFVAFLQVFGNLGFVVQNDKVFFVAVNADVMR